jgi:exodeoxyribonuclease V alpha subunit
MLQRNLLYTAVTRARRLVVLVGSRRALAKAIRTPGNGHRYTALDDRLRRGAIRLDEAAARRRADASR